MRDPFDNSPLVRTDFSDDAAWQSLVRAATAESPDGFLAELRIVDDSRFADCSVVQLIQQGEGWHRASVLFVADPEALSSREHPILCVDLSHEPGRSFRCIPSELWGVENNLRLANMDWEDFAEAVDGKGIHRGFE
jgi:hypothetical protein